MKVTLRNNFHDTETTISVKALERAVDAYMSSEGKKITSAARRVQWELCGIAGCLCSGFLGLRGPQEDFPIKIR